MILKKMIKLRPKRIAKVWVEEKPNMSLVHIEVDTLHKIHLFKKMDAALLNYVFTDRRAILESLDDNTKWYVNDKQYQDIILHLN